MSELDKSVSTPRGDARSMSSLSPFDVAANAFSQGGPDWFGPLPPMPPIAPAEVAGRGWDYQPGYNLATAPRTYEAVSFQMLRLLADSYDPLRLVIERRKDQICRLPWQIRVKHEGNGKRPKSSQLSSQMRGRIADITDFLRHPSSGLNFRSWLRAVLEDVLVIDAPAIYCERDFGGNLVALDAIDGSLIKVVIDSHGRTPRPFRWNGQPFDFCGQRIDASSYAQAGFKIADGLLWPPAYQAVLKNMPATNYTKWDLVYAPMNRRTFSPYGCSPVEQVMQTVNIAMRRATSQAQYFTEGNQPDAVFSLPAMWTPDQVQRFQDHWDGMFSGNTGNRRRMKFIPSDSANAYRPLHEPPLKTEFDEWLVRIICAAFSYPPSAFVSLSNRSIAEQHERSAEEEGLEPLKNWVADTINEIVEREFSEDVEFCFLEEDEPDQVAQAGILATLTGAGILTVNEARERLGEEPSNEPQASKLIARGQPASIGVEE